MADDSEISNWLFAIHADNKALRWRDGKVLMVTWNSAAEFEKCIKNQNQTAAQEAYVTWVTAALQVKEIADSPAFYKNLLPLSFLVADRLDVPEPVKVGQMS